MVEKEVKKKQKKKYEDKRDWKTYNQKLINRGEYYINPTFLDNWLTEIKGMNSGKVGQPYFYPRSLIEFLAFFYAKNFDYRALEGITKAISKKLGPFPVICFSQIRRRIIKLDLKFSPKKSNLVVGVDGTGFKVSNRGEWIRQAWNIRRGWIKIVIMGDTEGNIVDVRIGNENLDENASGRGMLRQNHKNIDKYMGDGLHDTKDNFNLLDHLGIKPVIKIRKNASTHSRGCLARRKAVLEYKKLGYKKWAKENEYGKRWLATEGIYSNIKRMFGETVKATKKRNMHHEARLKFWVYQQLKDLNPP